MGLDMRIDTGLPRHPKTKRLMRRLKADGFFALISLFAWVRENKSDGSMIGMSDEDIELAIDWMGEPGAFVAAAAEVGFLDGEEGDRSIHDWHERQPFAATASARSEKARLAGLISRYGEEKGRKMFHAYQARSLKNDDSESKTGNSELTGDNAESTQPPDYESTTSQLGSPKSSTPSLPSLPSTPTKAPKRARAAAFDPLSLTLPLWLPADSWAKWVKHRREKKAALTESTAEAQIEKLGEMRIAGHAPKGVIDWCVFKGWQGLFAPPPDADRGAPRVNGSAHMADGHPDDPRPRSLKELGLE
jgi:hypothetical protein